jgi:hypothetical protein
MTIIDTPMHQRLLLAYLDPGTGSYVFQLALASFLGAAYAMKQLWSHIREQSKRLFLRDARDNDR